LRYIPGGLRNHSSEHGGVRIRGSPQHFNSYIDLVNADAVYPGGVRKYITDVLYYDEAELARLGAPVDFISNFGTSLNLVFEGDSLTAALSSSYPEYLRQLLAGSYVTKVSNLGQGGEGISQILDSAETNAIDACIDSRFTKNIAVLWIGTNSLPGTDVETEIAALLAGTDTWCSGRLAAGFDHCVVLSLTPSANLAQGANHEEARLAYNVLLRSNYTEFADALVDIGADPIMGDYAQANSGPNFYYDSSKVHHSRGGWEIIASLVNTAILELAA